MIGVGHLSPLLIFQRTIPLNVVPASLSIVISDVSDASY